MGVLVLIVAALLLGGAAPDAMSYIIPWDALTSGSEQIQSAGYTIQASIGQALADAGASDTYGLEAGFWSGADVVVYAVYLPLTLR